MRYAVSMQHVHSPSRVHLPVGEWATYFEFFVERFPHISRQIWQARFDRGLVQRLNREPVAAQDRYQASQQLLYFREVADEVEIPFVESIVYEDDRIVVADKPHFLPVVPAGRYVTQTLLHRLRQRLKLDTLVPAHRLDLETAGLVLFTKHAQHRDAYQALFREQRVQKRYWAIAPTLPSAIQASLPLMYHSHLRERDGAQFMQMMEVADAAPNSETKIEQLRVFDNETALYQLEPSTGRKHQLRCHMAALGAPIVGDRIYPHLQPLSAATDFSAPLQLLAKRLAFCDPINGAEMLFESAQQLSCNNETGQPS
jgi:tRNA pseudouridine32 synthase / 23S rRNA pseudouridine746 synthase